MAGCRLDTLCLAAMKILVVEDDQALADGVCRSLRRGGYTVDHAAAGGEAVAACARGHYDLVILDIGLPDFDGFEVMRQLRRVPGPGAICILTARDAVEDRVQGLDLGADDYLVKPFALAELEARVRALLRRSQAAQHARMEIGTLAVDLAGKRAWIGRKPLELTAREWAVLEFLLTRVGQVVSKAQLMQALCDWEQNLSDNAIEVYVSRLRAKLQDAGLAIRTVRGFGYMIEEPRQTP